MQVMTPSERAKILKLIELMDYSIMTMVIQQVLSYDDYPFNFRLLDQLNHMLWEVCHHAKMGIIRDKEEAKEKIDNIETSMLCVRTHLSRQIVDAIKEHPS
jgi:hypothetical protein